MTCEGRHSILDRMEDVDEIEGLGAVVTVTFSQAIERRQQITSHLQTLLAGNDECIEKLRSLVDSNQLSARKSGTASAKKRLEEILQESEKEVKDKLYERDLILEFEKNIVYVVYNETIMDK